MIVQKYLHDLTAWDALPVEEQERAVGRTKLTDIELPDDVKPSNSHVALNTIVDDDGEERQIVRFNMPFGTVGAGEFGTYFIGYARTPEVIEQMLTNMFIGNPPGNYDRLLDFSTAVTGNLFFVPDRRVPRRPAVPGDSPAAEPAASAAAEPAGETVRCGDRHRSRGALAMNHLLRSLAPISDSGWELLDDEARERLDSRARRAQAGRLLRSARLGALGDQPRTRERRWTAAPAEGVTGRRRAGAPARRAASRVRPLARPSCATPTAAPTTPTSSRSTAPPTRSRWPRTRPCSAAGTG